ncbi:helix-turn-helix transcriptional regulator [uncultured Selenomonas sp.]|uniref:helix-turn-helix transcriptional regulator n=1 Tax=uncultured Selenomonas sp. TaxID=159275 RepID=UPI0025DD7B52|nr:helix-turn-helix transcriptional regulator [uncultured Selenomonas sp.]
MTKIYAANLRKFRKAVHLTQDEVAAELEITPQSYRAYESTTHPKFPRPDTLMKICNLFEKNIHDFFYISEQPESEGDDTGFSIREENDINDAIKNAIRPGDDIDCDLKYANGEIIARHRIFGVFTIPTRDLTMCLQVARESYRASLAGKIEDCVHYMERYHVYRKETVLFDELLAKQCGIDYDSIRRSYQTYDNFRWHTPPDRSMWDFPFITFREVLFYAYFVRINPLSMIEEDISKLEYEELSPEEDLKFLRSLNKKLKEPCKMSLNDLKNSKYAPACIDGIQINQTMNDAYLSSLGKQREEIQKDLYDHGSQPFDDLRFYLYLRDLYRQRWLHPTDTILHARIYNNHFLDNDTMIENGETPEIW